MLKRNGLRLLANQGDVLSFGVFRPDYVPWMVPAAERTASLMRRGALHVIRLGDRFMGARPKESLPRMRRLVTLGGHRPTIGANCFVAPSAVVVGNVTVGRKCGIWYNAVVRGDTSDCMERPLEIGEGTSIADKAVVKGRTIIGNYVCIEPMAVVDSAHIASQSFVGSGAIVCRGATMESGSMLCSASVLRSGAVVPSGEMWSGNPAQKVADLTEQEKLYIIRAAKHNVLVSVEHHDAWSYSWDEIETHRIAREVWHQWASGMMELRVKPFYVRMGPAAKQKRYNPLEMREGFHKFQHEKLSPGFGN